MMSVGDVETVEPIERLSQMLDHVAPDNRPELMTHTISSGDVDLGRLRAHQPVQALPQQNFLYNYNTKISRSLSIYPE